MAQPTIAERLTELLEPIAEANGYELVAVEQAGGRHTPVIRVLLDREGGIDLEAVAAANEWISEALDAADPIDSPYTLEVSSPGIDRPLRKRADYDRFAGSTVTVRAELEDGRKAGWTGTLEGLSGDEVVLDVEGDRVTIPLDHIRKARLKGVVDFGKERGATK